MCFWKCGISYLFASTESDSRRFVRTADSGVTTTVVIVNGVDIAKREGMEIGKNGMKREAKTITFYGTD